MTLNWPRTGRQAASADGESIECGYLERFTNPALGGYGPLAMNAALAASMGRLPVQVRQTLTWDRGRELSGHAQFTLATGTKVFFADLHPPWQRPSNEITNWLLRHYLPKGTDLPGWTAEDLGAVALAIDDRPRNVPGRKTPAEAFTEQLRSLQQPGVAPPHPMGPGNRVRLPLRLRNRGGDG